jgi:hypothetical protein
VQIVVVPVGNMSHRACLVAGYYKIILFIPVISIIAADVNPDVKAASPKNLTGLMRGAFGQGGSATNRQV